MGRTTVEVRGTNLLVADLIPDLLMADKESLRVNYKDLVVVKHLGTGSYGTIDEAKWNGESVAVKVITIALEEERAQAFEAWTKEVAIMR